MTMPILALALLLGFEPEPADPGPIWEAAGRDPYLLGKRGFPKVSRAVGHAVAEFHAAVRQRRIDPSRDEFFSYVYTFQPPGGGRRLFFHSQWWQAMYEKTEAGSMRHRVGRPYAENGSVRVYTFIHTHPTGLGGSEGPSRVDVATASRYRRPDGSFRYLYLINNRGTLVRFKARRDIDPHNAAALARMPVRPRAGVDWVD
ncbi:hypothetical protein [Geothrix sp. 21YS21S-2]|uniref:hypothetical protein n=1 Tax=Geothrix sp. 21YS21S-2 TaxID=3068893 RepID=UPI0027BB0771|nr:hypothetical protein [Geothrix sp. 21YS21S-2]